MSSAYPWPQQVFARENLVPLFQVIDGRSQLSFSSHSGTLGTEAGQHSCHQLFTTETLNIVSKHTLKLSFNAKGYYKKQM